MTDQTSKNETSTGTMAVSSAGDLPLESYIAKNGPMNWRECLGLFHDVCFSMENPQVDSVAIGELSIHSFVVKKTDTANGISIEILNNTVSDETKEHSPPKEAYQSPERCLDRPVNRRSDVYSLGCVIYHCLTGAPPFLHRDTEKLKEMQTIDYALPPGRRSQRRLIPDEVDALVLTCMEKDPARRYKNAGTLRANIGRVLQMEDASDEPSSRSAKFAEFCQRKRKVFISVAILVAATAGLSCWALEMASSEGFNKLVQRTIDRKRNKYFLSLEHGPMYAAQAEFENGKMIPDLDKDAIYLKVKDEDLIIFASTKRTTVKDTLEEAVRRKLILYRVDLIGQDLKGAIVSGGNFDHSIMAGCNLDGANFQGSQLKNSIFTESTVKGGQFEAVNAPEVFFDRCNLENANFHGAMLLDCDFSKSNLKNANFSNANLLNSNFQGADLTGANFTGATIAKYGFKTAKFSPDQEAVLNKIEGPVRNSKEVERQAKGLNLLVPKSADDFKEKNPFSNPVEGSNTFSHSEDAPIGLKIDLTKPMVDIPKKKGAAPPPPLQQAIPGKPITLPSAQTPPTGVPSTPVGGTPEAATPKAPVKP